MQLMTCMYMLIATEFLQSREVGIPQLACQDKADGRSGVRRRHHALELV